MKSSLEIRKELLFREIQMALFPYCTQKIRTALSFEEVTRDIENILYEEKEEYISLLGEKKYHALFIGWIRNTNFKLIRRQLIRNTFKITVVGKILENQSGTLIKLRFRMIPISYVFTFVLLCLTTIPIIDTYNSSGNFSLLSSIMFISLYLLMMLGFNYDLYMIKKHLSKYIQNWESAIPSKK